MRERGARFREGYDERERVVETDCFLLIGRAGPELSSEWEELLVMLWWGIVVDLLGVSPSCNAAE